MGRMIPFAVLAAWLLAVGDAHAGWKGVFEATCFHRSAPAAAYYPPPQVSYYAPAPQQVCTTYYQQRCYYQPVTTYRVQTYYEPVTSYRTSWYWEPVVNYRYRSYYDPCTCTFQRVATPYTTYRLKQGCTAVTNWVQRCGYVPETSWQRSCYWEPRTCCYYVDPCTGAVIPTNGIQPGVTENPPAVPRVTEYPPTNDSWRPLYEKNGSGMEGSGSSYRPRLDPIQVPKDLDPPKVPAAPRLDRVAFEQPLRPGPANVVGQVVSGKNDPKPGAQLVFVPDAASGKSTDAQADADGRFQIDLPPGEYLVYLRDQDGRAVYHTTLKVKSRETNQLRLVSR